MLKGLGLVKASGKGPSSMSLSLPTQNFRIRSLLKTKDLTAIWAYLQVIHSKGVMGAYFYGF